MSPWISFGALISVEFLVFIIFAVLQRRTPKDIAVVLAQSLLLGLIFGVPFDLIIGSFAGLYSYVNGFTVPFLVANGIFSFGLWQATIVILRKKQLFSFSAHIAVTCAVYETVNIFFPVWQWKISDMLAVQMGVVLFGYTIIAIGGALVASLIFKTAFAFLPLQTTKNNL